jgi:acyl-coenzyme A synthetase/AMP-(fatty) acid ligase
MLLDRADVRTRHDMTSLQKSTRGAVWSPKSVEFRNDLPVTALGKLDRKVARAPYWAGHSRDVG